MHPALLQDHRVEEWVSHGLNLPQHAAAFRAAAITALDFPFLVADGGAGLAAELGVTSKLHQQQVGRCSTAPSFAFLLRCRPRCGQALA